MREQIRAAQEWVMARPTATYIDVVTGCFAQLRGRKGVRSIGNIGYRIGGRLTAELAGTEAELGAAVIN